MNVLGSLLQFLLLLSLLVLWGIAFWKQRPLANGIAIGIVVAAVLGWLFQGAGPREIPVWLPALPFALVAASLFCLAFLAWHWGKKD